MKITRKRIDLPGTLCYLELVDIDGEVFERWQMYEINVATEEPEEVGRG